MTFILCDLYGGRVALVTDQWCRFYFLLTSRQKFHIRFLESDMQGHVFSEERVV
jgi:hypothetical protein